MKSKRSRLAIVGVLALTLSVTVGLSAGSAQAAKKKKKVGGTVDITQAVNGAIPDATATTNGTLTSAITVGGKKFKGSKVRDVNVTLQTQATAGASPADNLTARLTAPDGTTTWLFGVNSSPFGGGSSIGPLTFDDETPNNLITGGAAAPAPDSTTVVSPYVGTAQPHCYSAQGGCSLAAMDNGAASGTWTLRIQDAGTIGETSNLVSWRLLMVAGKKFKT